MAWVDVGTRAGLYEGSTLRGYCHFEYDNSSGTTSRNCRLRIEATGSQTFTVNFNNITINGVNKGSVSGVKQNSGTIWTGSVAAGSATAKWTNPWYAGTKTPTVTGTIPSGATAPTGLGLDSVSTGWDTGNNRATVTGRAYLSNYGTGGTMTSLSLLVLEQSYVAGLPHRYANNTGGATSYTFTLSNGSACSGAGCIDIKGASDYYLGVFADNGPLQERYPYPSKVYTPPSPLASLTYSQSQGATNVTVSFTATGGSSSLNGSNNVTTQYRYSTNGGSSYTSWTSISGTATAWTAKSGSFTCNYGASVVIQARQVYQSQYSNVKQVSFTATSGTAPSGGSVSITSATWNSVTLSASGVNYGKPNGISGRKISVGVSGSSANLNYKRENQLENVTSANTTVTNSSVYPGANALTLKGMLPVYAYLWAWNTVQSNTLAHSSTAYYLPPAPGTLTYTAPAQGQSTATVNYTGVASNNVADYTAADLKRTVRYSVDGGAWVYEVNDVATAVDANTNFTITIPAQESAVVEAWMSYKGKENSHSSTTIVNGNQPVHLYGSVNGTAEEIVHLYGSVTKVTIDDIIVGANTIINAVHMTASQMATLQSQINVNLLDYVKQSYTINRIRVSGSGDVWSAYVELEKTGSQNEYYYICQNVSKSDFESAVASWGIPLVTNYPDGSDSFSILAIYRVNAATKIKKLYGSQNGVCKKIFEDLS